MDLASACLTRLDTLDQILDPTLCPSSPHAMAMLISELKFSQGGTQVKTETSQTLSFCCRLNKEHSFPFARFAPPSKIEQKGVADKIPSEKHFHFLTNKNRSLSLRIRQTFSNVIGESVLHGRFCVFVQISVRWGIRHCYLLIVLPGCCSRHDTSFSVCTETQHRRDKILQHNCESDGQSDNDVRNNIRFQVVFGRKIDISACWWRILKSV